MKRAVICLLAALLVLTGTVFAFEEFDPNEWAAAETLAAVDDLPLNVSSALLMEKETGTVIYEHNAHERNAPASITKIMTMLLIAEAIEDGRLSLDDTVTTSTYASQMGGSQIFLKEGEEMNLNDMLKSIAVASANDASVALAEHLAGSESAFVSMMNERAKQLNMTDTVFANCTGLPSESEHLTCAYDIAIMSRELIKHDMIKNYSKIWMDSVRGGEFGLSNTNKLIRFYNGATGLKTGFTNEAMFCLSATAERDGVEYIAVIMHAPSSDIRFESAKMLLNHAFATYTLVDACPSEALAPIPVTLGEVKFLQPVLESEDKLLIEKSRVNGLVKNVDIIDSIKAPVEAGLQIGTLTIKDDKGSILKTVPIVTESEVNRLNWGQVFVKYLRILFVGSL